MERLEDNASPSILSRYVGVRCWLLFNSDAGTSNNLCECGAGLTAGICLHKFRKNNSAVTFETAKFNCIDFNINFCFGCSKLIDVVVFQ